MIDVKLMKQGLEELVEARRIPMDKVTDGMEKALAAAYQKEYGEKGQLIKCSLDFDNGSMHFMQNKIVVDNEAVRGEEEGDFEDNDPRALLPKFNEERHIMVENARLLKKSVEVGEELSFPLDDKDDFGRIALQTAKQVIMQSMREAEREITATEFADKVHTVVSGVVERVERGLTFVEINKTSVILPLEEQIRGERLMPGSRVRAYLMSMDDNGKGLSIKLSRTHPQFLVELFKIESTEIEDGIVEIVHVAREPGSRSKIAVKTNDEKIDAVGACVGQRGSRINAVTQELHGEKIDIVMYSEDIREFIKNALSPAKPISIEISEEEKTANVKVYSDEQSLAIGKGGQNVRLAARLTGYRIDISSDEEGETKEESSNQERSDFDTTDEYTESMNENTPVNEADLKS